MEDRMLPDRNESNKTDFLRLRSQFDVEYPVEWGEKLYSEIMLCIEKTKAKIQQDAKSRVDKGRVFVHHNNNHLKTTRLEYIPFNKNRESSFITMFTKYYHKLERDHNKATICTDDKKIIYRYANYDNRTPLFLKRIFSMMQRYHTLWHKNSGAHGALPDEVFHALKTNLKVEGECFASPLNHGLPKFYSAFPDTDKCFGSLGSFFDEDNKQMIEVGKRILHLISAVLKIHWKKLGNYWRTLKGEVITYRLLCFWTFRKTNQSWKRA